MSEEPSGGGTNRLERRPPPAIPITVLTGFLGAGKTTLLNQWVRSPEFRHAAVVINEFGDVAIDHLLVESVEGTMLTLSSGCLCCTVRGDLVTTLEDLIRARDNNRVEPFDRLVIETSGLAEPGPVLNAIMAHPYLPMRFRLDGVIAVVDAQAGGAALATHVEAREQVAVADVLVLTKTDLEPAPTSRPSLEDALRALNGSAPILDAARSEATAKAVLARPMREWADIPHDHHHHHHGAIRSVAIHGDTPLDPAAFSMFVDLLRANHGAKLLRVKGLVALVDRPERPLVIQGVQHFFHPPHRLERWPDGDHRSRLVFILRDLDPAVIEALWQGFFGGPRIDTADGAALTQSLGGHPGLLG